MAQGNKHALIAASLMPYRDCPGDRIRNVDIDNPLSTVTAEGNLHAITCATLIRQFGSSNSSNIGEPLKTVMSEGAGGKNAVIAAMLLKHNGGHNQAAGSEITEPIHTITAQDHHSLAAVTLISN